MAVPWQRHLDLAAARPPSSPGSDSDSEDDFDSGPPRSLLDTAREVVGQHVVQRQVAAAWDGMIKQLREHGRKLGEVPEAEKIEMALGRLFDNQLEPAPPPSPVRAPPAVQTGLFRPPSPDTPDDPKPGDSAHKRPERDADEKTSGSKGKGKGKGKGRYREVIELDSDDDLPLQPRKSPKRPRDSPGPSDPTAKRQRRGDTAAVIIDDDSPMLLAPPPVAGPSAPRPQPQPTSSPSRPVPTGKDLALVQIIDIVPDVLPSHALALYEETFRAIEEKDRVAAVVDHLFNQSNYPKVEKDVKGKGKAKREPTPVGNAIEEGKRRWLAADRPRYFDATLVPRVIEILTNDFLTMPKSFIKYIAKSNKYLLAPAWLALKEELDRVPQKYQTLKTARQRTADERNTLPQGDIKEEWAWLSKKLEEEVRVAMAEAEEKALEAAEQTAGMLIECQCCFSEFRFVKMVQCPEAHLFCTDCARQNAETALGQRKHAITCMDGSGCQELFTDAELARVLDKRSMNLLEKIRAEKSIDGAEIEGLERCPFCPWAAVIDNPDERLFHCGNEDCERVSCRKCHRPDHIPKTCEEVEADEKSNNIHKVEEAMSEALIRRCPKCHQPFVKEDGCNKMMCSNCRTLSCFVCGKPVHGYEHFSNAGENLGGRAPDPNATCPLFDDTRKRTHDEVERARQAAAAEVQQNNANVDAAAIERLRNEAPPPPAVPHLMGLPAPQYVPRLANLAGVIDRLGGGGGGGGFPVAHARGVPAAALFGGVALPAAYEALLGYQHPLLGQAAAAMAAGVPALAAAPAAVAGPGPQAQAAPPRPVVPVPRRARARVPPNPPAPAHPPARAARVAPPPPPDAQELQRALRREQDAQRRADQRRERDEEFARRRRDIMERAQAIIAQDRERAQAVIAQDRERLAQAQAQDRERIAQAQAEARNAATAARLAALQRAVGAPEPRRR